MTENQRISIYIFDFIVAIILAIDFYDRMKASEQGTKKFLLNRYEIPAMLPLFAFGIIGTNPIIGGALRSLRLIRLFRLVRLVRLVNLFRTARYLKRSGFIYFLIISAVAILFGSTGMYIVERDYEGATIKNIADAFWFSLTTVIISGHGDVVPVSPEAKVIAAVLIVIVLALILGFITYYGATIIESG